MIDHSTIARIMDTADILDVVQDFVHMKKRGVNYIGLCPFHNEKTPSFTVSPSKGIFKCFGCGKGGNPVNFIMEHEHLSYPEALKFLAKKYHIEVEEKELSPEDHRKQNERESMLVVSTWAEKHFHQLLFQHQEGTSIGLTYFRERGFRTDTLKKFMVGYALDQWEAFTKAALDAGYKKEYLVKTGLTIEKETKLFDRFRGRVLFPVHSLSGQVLGFGGRTLKKDARAAKYLNSPESEIYHKSKILYGIYQARKKIVQEDKCYLVEGYTDVLSMHESGQENVVASSGTALTQEQIRLIKRFTRNITIIYDGDEAGIKASLRGIDLTLEEGMNVRVVPLPEGEDPDSYSKGRSAGEFQEYLDREEQDFIHFKTRLLMAEAKTDPVRRAQMVKEVVQSISYIPESITRTIYIKESAGHLDMQESILHTEVARLRRKRYERKRDKYPGLEDLPQVQQKHAVPVPAQPEYAYERALIRYLLLYGHREFTREKDPETGKEIPHSVADYIVADITADELEFEHPGYKAIFDDFLFHTSQGMVPDERHFTRHIDEKISRLAADILTENYQLSKIWETHENYVQTEEMKLKKLIPDTLLSFKKEKINKAMKELQKKLQKAQEEDDMETMLSLQEQFQHMNRMKKELALHLGKRIIL